MVSKAFAKPELRTPLSKGRECVLQRAAYVWGLHGQCNSLGINCTMVSGTYTYCDSICNCMHLLKTIWHLPGVDVAAIQFKLEK